MTNRADIERKIKQRAADHPPECDCTTCRAAAGDQQAMNRLVKQLI